MFFPLLAFIAAMVVGSGLAILALIRQERPVNISCISLCCNILAGLVGVAYLFALLVFCLVINIT